MKQKNERRTTNEDQPIKVERPKRRFFFPSLATSVMAVSLDEAIKKVGENLEEKPQDV